MLKSTTGRRWYVPLKIVVYWLLASIVVGILVVTFLTDLIVVKTVETEIFFEAWENEKVENKVQIVTTTRSVVAGNGGEENKNLMSLFANSGSKFAILYNFSLVRLNPENELFWNNVNCCYYNLWRVGISNIYTETKLATSGVCYPIIGQMTEIPLHHLYILVMCKDKKTGGIQYQDSFASKLSAQEPMEEYMPKKETNMLGAIFLGFESMTLAEFKEKMPFSAHFLKNTVGAQEFSNFQEPSILASHNIAALLSGVDVPPRGVDMRSMVMSHNSEEFPWLWSDTFPFRYVSVQEEPSLGPLPGRVLPSSLTILRDYFQDLRNLVEVAPIGLKAVDGPHRLGRFLANLLLFSNSHASDTSIHFTWISREMLKRDVLMADLYLRATLGDLYERKVLNKTALILFSQFGDYQMELADIKLFLREKRKFLGKRRPFLYMNLPDWFGKAYPKFHQEFLNNKKKAVTPGDIYRTILEIDTKTKDSILEKHSTPTRETTKEDKHTQRSLFRRLPAKGSCKDLGVQDLACNERERVALKKKQLDIVTRIIMPKVIEIMNEVAQELGSCENMTLRRLVGGSKVKTLDEDNGERNGSVQLELVFETGGNQGIWEAAVRVDARTVNLTDLIPIRPLFNPINVALESNIAETKIDRSCVDSFYLDDVQYLCKCRQLDKIMENTSLPLEYHFDTYE